MKQFISIHDVENPLKLAEEAINLKQHPKVFDDLGVGKVLGLLFFNPSLRTRMSTTRAAYNLGMKVMALNVAQDSWTLETEDGVVMDQGAVEHVREAAAVMGQYCEILGVRSFPSLQNREKDYSEQFIKSFTQFSNIPVINLESSTLHPLQSLADLVTILEYKKTSNPKIVMTWAPHVKALPQSVPNSFAQWINHAGFDLTIVQPEGFELNPDFSGKATIEYDQNKALDGADFVYVKNWSSYKEYGKISTTLADWMVTKDKLNLTNNAKLMHCLPVRRNVVIADNALESKHSIITAQAANRICSAQAVLKEILLHNYPLL